MQLKRPFPFRQASWCLDAQSSERGSVELSRTVIAALDLHPFCQEAILEVGASAAYTAGTEETRDVYTAKVTQPLYKYYVRAIEAYRVSGDNTFDLLFFRSRLYEQEAAASATYMILDSFVAGTQEIVDLKHPFWMGPGDALALRSDVAGVAATVFGLKLWCDRLRCG